MAGIAVPIQTIQSDFWDNFFLNALCALSLEAIKRDKIKDLLESWEAQNSLTWALP
jgi:hypothetical protein